MEGGDMKVEVAVMEWHYESGAIRYQPMAGNEQLWETNIKVPGGLGAPVPIFKTWSAKSHVRPYTYRSFKRAVRIARRRRKAQRRHTTVVRSIAEII